MSKIRAYVVIALAMVEQFAIGVELSGVRYGIHRAADHRDWLKRWANSAQSYGPTVPGHWASKHFQAAVVIWQQRK